MKALTTHITPDCHNAPKKAFIRDLNLAFAGGNADFIIQHVSDDITWEILGDKKIEGKEAFAKAIMEMAGCPATGLSIHHIITHGKEGAANGEIMMEGNKRYAFSDIYVFVSAGKNIIRRMYSYIVPVVKD